MAVKRTDPGGARLGAHASFEAFFRAEYGPNVAFARSIVGDVGRAEDLVQTAMVRAHDRWAEVGRYERPGAWVRTVTYRLCISALRSDGAEQRALARLPQQAVASMPLRDDSLWAAVGSLPARQRAAVALFYAEDRPIAEIAEVMGCSQAAVRVHLHSARTTLAGRLAALDGGEA